MEVEGINLLKWNSLKNVQEILSSESSESRDDEETTFANKKKTRPVPQINIVKPIVGESLFLLRPELLTMLENLRDFENLEEVIASA